jgi:hypothetical protein
LGWISSDEEVVFVLFVTESMVCGQQGEPEVYLRQEDLKLIAKDRDARKAVLESLCRPSLLVAGTEETSDVSVDLAEVSVDGPEKSFHSKL